MRSFFYLAVGFMLCGVLPAESLKSMLKPANLEKRIKKEIAALDLGFDVKMLDAEISQGIGIAAKYRYEVEPSYKDQYYTRVDKWKLNGSLKPGDFVPEFDWPVNLNISAGKEIVFVRQFSSQKDAFKALPCTPARIPWNADRAIEKMQPGDFVSIPAKLNLVINAGLSTEQGVLEAGASTHYLLSGEFMIQIYRMKENQIRMKIISMRKRGKGVNANVKADFDIFGIKFVDKAIKKFIDVEPAKLGLKWEEGDVFVFDYVLDLNQQVARDIYDDMIKRSFTFETLSVLNPFQGNRELEESIIRDMGDLDDTAVRSLDTDKPSVRRLFKGINDFDTYSGSFKLGTNFLKFERKTTYTENHLSWYDEKDNRKDFFFPVYSSTVDRKFLFGLFKYSRKFSSYAIFDSDMEGNPSKFRSYGIFYELKDKHFSWFDFQDFKSWLNRVFSDETLAKLDLSSWKEADDLDQVRVGFKLLLSSSAIERLSQMDLNGYFSKMAEFASTLKALPSSNNNHHGGHSQHLWSGKLPGEKEATAVFKRKNFHRLHRGMRSMVKRLHEMFTSGNDAENYNKIIKGFMELKENHCFTYMGLGYLLHLMGNDIKDEGYFSLNLHARKIKDITLESGHADDLGMYKNLQAIMAVINGRDCDLRLHQEESLSEMDLLSGDRQYLFEELYSE